MKVNKNKKIIYNKNMGILSGERSRSTNNKDGRPKKVFNPALKIKGKIYIYYLKVISAQIKKITLVLIV